MHTIFITQKSKNSEVRRSNKAKFKLNRESVMWKFWKRRKHWRYNLNVIRENSVNMLFCGLMTLFCHFSYTVVNFSTAVKRHLVLSYLTFKLCTESITFETFVRRFWGTHMTVTLDVVWCWWHSFDCHPNFAPTFDTRIVSSTMKLPLYIKY